MKNLREFTDAMHEAAEKDGGEWATCYSAGGLCALLEKWADSLVVAVEDRDMRTHDHAIRLALIAAEIARVS